MTRSNRTSRYRLRIEQLASTKSLTKTCLPSRRPQIKRTIRLHKEALSLPYMQLSGVVVRLSGPTSVTHHRLQPEPCLPKTDSNYAVLHLNRLIKMTIGCTVLSKMPLVMLSNPTNSRGALTSILPQAGKRVRNST